MKGVREDFCAPCVLPLVAGASTIGISSTYFSSKIVWYFIVFTSILSIIYILNKGDCKKCKK